MVVWKEMMSDTFVLLHGIMAWRMGVGANRLVPS